mgnify:CR=1 FL=1
MNVFISKSLGVYNLAGPGKKQWLVELRVKGLRDLPVALSATWEEDDEPDIDGLSPSEVMDLLERRFESYLIDTSREKRRASLAWMRENAEEIDKAWAASRVESFRKEVESLNRKIASLTREYNLGGAK